MKLFAYVFERRCQFKQHKNTKCIKK